MAPYPQSRFYPYPSDMTCKLNCTDACSFYNLCPPPPPPPPLPPTPQNPTTPIRLHHSSRLSLALIASAASLAAASLLLLLSCFLSLRLRCRRRRLRRSATGGAAAIAAGEVAAEGLVDEDGEVDHHVWYIRTVGLDEPTIGAIAVWVFQSGEGVLDGGGGGGCCGGGGGCAVCLAEFRDGELLRLLPKCGHAFHVACIDAWLRGHVNCPLCRAPIMAPAPAPAPPALPSSSPSQSPPSSSSSLNATDSDHDGSNLSNQVEIRGIEGEAGAGYAETGDGNGVDANWTVEVPSSSSSRVLSDSRDKL